MPTKDIPLFLYFSLYYIYDIIGRFNQYFLKNIIGKYLGLTANIFYHRIREYEAEHGIAEPTSV